MSDPESLAALRELFLTAEIPFSTQLITILGSFALAGVVMWLVRRRGLREEYTPIWLGVALGLALISLRLEWLYAIARAIGAWTASSTLFFFGQLFLVAICLNYAVRLSRQGIQLKNLAQELAILRARLEARRD